ncbi:MAG: hypothetical protein WDO14_24845 [Bacteroidota bacterium]
MRFLYAYRTTIAFPANTISVIACVVAYTTASLSGFLLLFWMKLITSLILIGYTYLFNRKVIFFFMNLGVGERQLYTSVVVIDSLIFIIEMLVIYFTR